MEARTLAYITHHFPDTFLDPAAEAPVFMDAVAASTRNLYLQMVRDGEVEMALKTVLYLGGRLDPLRTVDGYGNSALHYASHFGWPRLVEWLVRSSAEQGTPSFPVNSTGATPLMLAAEVGNMTVVTILAQAPDFGASLAVTNMNGWTARRFALEFGHHDIAAMLTPA